MFSVFCHCLIVETHTHNGFTLIYNKGGVTMSAHRSKAKHSMGKSNFGASVNTIQKWSHRWMVTGK